MQDPHLFRLLNSIYLRIIHLGIAVSLYVGLQVIFFAPSLQRPSLHVTVYISPGLIVCLSGVNTPFGIIGLLQMQDGAGGSSLTSMPLSDSLHVSFDSPFNMKCLSHVTVYV